MTPPRQSADDPTRPSHPPQRRPSRRWIGIGAALVLVLAGLGLGLWQVYQTYAPGLTREHLEGALSTALGRPVRIERVLLRPWLAQIDLLGVSVASAEPAGGAPLLRAGRVNLQLGISSIWRREVVLSRLEFRDLSLRLEATATRGPALALPPGLFQETLRAGPVHFAIRQVQVVDGRVLYRDRRAGRSVAIAGLEAAARHQRGAIGVRLRAASLAVQVGAFRQSLARLEGDGQLGPNLLEISRLTARWQGEPLRLFGEVRDPFSRPLLALEVQGRLDLARLREFVKLPWPPAGTAQVAASVRGRPEALSVSGRATAAALTIGRFRAREVSAQAAWQGNRLDVSLLQAQAFGGNLRGSLHLPLDRPAETRLRLQVRHASVAALEALAPRPLGFHGSLDLAGEVTGALTRIDQLRGQVRLAASQVELPGKLGRLGSGRASLEAALHDGEAELSRATGEWPGVHLDAAGGVAPAGPAGLHLEVSADLATVGRLAGLRGAAGQARLSALANGTWVHPLLKGRLAAATASLSGIMVDRVDVPFRLGDQVLTIESARGSVSRIPVQLGGTATWTGELAAALSDPQRSLQLNLDVRAPSARWENLGPWLPPGWRGAGAFSIAGRIEGPPDAYRIAGSLQAGALEAPHAVPIEDLHAAFTGDPRGLRIAHLTARVRGIPLSGDGSWDWSGIGQGTAEVGPAGLARLPGLPSGLSLAGSARGRFQIAWRQGALTGAGQIALRQARLLDLPLGDGSVRLESREGRVQATFGFAQAGVSGTLAGRPDPAATLVGQLSVRDLSLTPLLRHLAGPSTGVVLGGIVTGRAEVRLTLADPAAAQGTATLESLRLQVSGEEWSNRGPIVLRWAAGTLQTAQLVLASRLGQLSLTGHLQASGPVALEARGQFPLGLLPLFSPEVRQAAGTLTLTAQVSGTLSLPRLAGEGTIAGGRLQLRDYPETLRDLHARLLVSPSGLRVVEATAAVGSGGIRVNGELNLQGRRVTFYRFALSGKSVTLPALDNLRSTWNLDLTVVGEGSRLAVTGQGRLVQGSYTGQLSLLSALLPQGPEGGPAPPTLSVPLRVQLQFDNNLVIQTNLARLRVGGSVSLEGTTARPILFGTLESHEGQITFRGNRWSVTSASAQFSDPRRIDPFLSILATTRIRDYEVTMHLSGRAENLQLQFTSSPPLTETELLSLVTLGVTPQEAGRSAPGIVAGEVASLLIKNVLGEQASALGLSRLEIGTTAVAGQSQPEVGLQVSRNVRLQYSQGLNASSRRVLRLEYQVLGPLYLTGEQDFQGGYGGGFLLRLRFR